MIRTANGHELTRMKPNFNHRLKTTNADTPNQICAYMRLKSLFAFIRVHSRLICLGLAWDFEAAVR